MAEPDILTEREEGVLWIRLNRPERRNAITPDQRVSLVETFVNAGVDLHIRAIVLTGVGDSFCGGSDATAARPAPPRPEGAPARSVGFTTWLIRTGVQQLVTAIRECEKPVIAAVNGRTADVGFHLALACDFVVASSEATFTETFVNRGILPDGGGFYLLPRIVGLQRAKEIVLLGGALSAQQALAMGIVNEVVDPGEVEAAARTLAGRLSSGATKAQGLAKQLLNRSFDSDLTEAFYEEAHAQELVIMTKDATEGRRSGFRGW